MKVIWKFLLFAFAMFTWVTQLTLLDWVFNFALYRGMEYPLWMFQLPINGTVFYLSTWHAYIYAVFMLHVALVLMVVSLNNLYDYGRKSETMFNPSRDDNKNGR